MSLDPKLKELPPAKIKIAKAAINPNKDENKTSEPIG
jgi:hypothetical protein